MLPPTSPDVLLLAHKRGEELRRAAVVHRLRGRSRGRLAVADLLRRAADRLDPALQARPGLT